MVPAHDCGKQTRSLSSSAALGLAAVSRRRSPSSFAAAGTHPGLEVAAARPAAPRPVSNQPPAHANPVPTLCAQDKHSGRPRAAILTSAAGSRRRSDAMAGGWEEVRPGRPVAAPSASGTEGRQSSSPPFHLRRGRQEVRHKNAPRPALLPVGNARGSGSAPARGTRRGEYLEKLHPRACSLELT